MPSTQTRIPFSRRDLLRAAVTLGGMATMATLLEACGSTGAVTDTSSAISKPSATAEQPTRTTARPSSTSAAEPTHTPLSTATAPPEPTITPQATATVPPKASDTPQPSPTAPPEPTITVGPTETALAGGARVAFVKTRDRAEGVRRALALLGVNPVRGNRVLLKPNFNSADPTPGSTHNDVLRALIEESWDMGAQKITVADRSGMGDTRRVMEQKGIPGLADELAFDTLVLDELESSDWVMMGQRDSYWQRGFPIARQSLETDALIQTCCLKTHRFGGHFTLSLKNSVGLVAKFGPGDGYNYMNELHSSPNQRRMIADINAAYAPDLIVMDGVEAFVNAGPDTGKKVQSEVVLAATDRVAIDAVGVALLRHFGTTPEVSSGPIFQLEQIARAVDLGLGVEGPEAIELITDDAQSAEYAKTIQDILLKG